MHCSDQHIHDTILCLLNQREPGATVCPSEVARTLAPNDWRPLMPRVREVAIDMARRSALTIRQKGHNVDPKDQPHGPIRLGMPHQQG
ncbi:DUF3253 domain-containing protein [Bordetella ansorpii]|uniref:DUF3253 domain-containing protein n=1 Tax=Bordetella ansorpii TaxID=288768 RepID=UPI0009ED4DF9